MIAVDVVRRAWRNLVRVPGRTLLLFVVLGAIIGLAVMGLAVQAGAEVGLLDAKRNMGNEVRLSPNLMNLRRAALSGQGAGGAPAVISVPTVPESLVDTLAKSKYVTAVDRSDSGLVISPDLKPVSVDSAGGQNGQGGFGGPGGQFFPGQSIFQELGQSFRLIGNSLPGAVLTSGRNELELVSGRVYTAEEVASGAPVALIDESLAQANNLTVGDTFTLQSRDGTTKETFTIIGITRDISPATEEFGTSGGGPVFRANLFGAANQILAPYTAVQRLKGETGQVNSATFYLDSPENIDAFRQEAIAAGLDTDKYSLNANDLAAQAAAAPFQALEGFARVGLIALVVVGALVVVLVMSLVTRERKLEIGVLRALGASRRNIAAQFVVETATICLVALLVGGLVGGLAAQTSAERLLQREVAAMQSSATGRTAVLPNGISIIQRSEGRAATSTPEIQVRFGWRELAGVLGLGLVLSVAGSAAAVYWGMRVEPASILTSRN